jgi:hypothetical protein
VIALYWNLNINFISAAKRSDCADNGSDWLKSRHKRGNRGKNTFSNGKGLLKNRNNLLLKKVLLIRLGRER